MKSAVDLTGHFGRAFPCSGPAQAGQALLCSNYHWLADPAGWNGGLIHFGDNAVLLLNLAAAAAAVPAAPAAGGGG